MIFRIILTILFQINSNSHSYDKCTRQFNEKYYYVNRDTKDSYSQDDYSYFCQSIEVSDSVIIIRIADISQETMNSRNSIVRLKWFICIMIYMLLWISFSLLWFSFSFQLYSLLFFNIYTVMTTWFIVLKINFRDERVFADFILKLIQLQSLLSIKSTGNEINRKSNVEFNNNSSEYMYLHENNDYYTVINFHILWYWR